MNFLFELPAPIFHFVEQFVTWIGFSTIVGLIGSNLVLRRNPPNSIITVLIGFAGTIIGWSIARVYLLPNTKIEEATADHSWKVELLSPATFIIGLIGTIFLLFLYMIIAKNMAKEK